MWVQEIAHQAEHAAPETHGEAFNAGKTIIEHVSNAKDHPIFRLPAIMGIDFSVTKHVFMLWLVAAIVFVVVTWTVRRYLRQDRLEPSGFMNPLEAVVGVIRDQNAGPNRGRKGGKPWVPLILTLFHFLPCAN